MPRTNPLPAREAAICRRVREFRLSTRLSRIAFAKELEVDSSLLVRIEHGLSPVRHDVARRLMFVFNLNPAWLIEGKGEPTVIEPVKTPEDFAPDQLFSHLYDHSLKGAMEHMEKNGQSAAQLLTTKLDHLSKALKADRGALAPAQIAQLDAIVLQAIDCLSSETRRREARFSARRRLVKVRSKLGN